MPEAVERPEPAVAVAWPADVTRGGVPHAAAVVAATELAALCFWEEQPVGRQLVQASFDHAGEVDAEGCCAGVHGDAPLPSFRQRKLQRGSRLDDLAVDGDPS